MTHQPSLARHRLTEAPIAVLAAALLAAILLVAAAWSPLAAESGVREYRAGDIRVRQPWTRATPKGAPVAGGYVTIVNAGKTMDRLVGGSFALAGRFEVHEMSMTGGVMRMRHLPAGLAIQPGQTVELKPGGYHLMFMQLKGQITPGQPVKGALIFEKAGRIDVEFAVAPLGAKSPPMRDGHGQHMRR